MRSDFEKNRYWIGLFRTDVEFNALLGEFGRYELNGSRDVCHSYVEAFNAKWEAYANAWQHRQTEVDELQKRVDGAYIKLAMLRQTELWREDDIFELFDELEQALKGEG
ncbi:hypothetical protein [Acinetobacter gyllenbergii]|uniref:hypothetical protein n=1 Tax=Acinetobacter gyllenbergii TaxID=134534 RepID=UPI000806B3AA|nr:hypothetical protein [Acinetobacter gyllenbergii]OBY75921.1 hypothetical protein NG55_04410 [Acinetobacter gyllenbergii]